MSCLSRAWNEETNELSSTERYLVNHAIVIILEPLVDLGKRDMELHKGLLNLTDNQAELVKVLLSEIPQPPEPDPRSRTIDPSQACWLTVGGPGSATWDWQQYISVVESWTYFPVAKSGTWGTWNSPKWLVSWNLVCWMLSKVGQLFVYVQQPRDTCWGFRNAKAVHWRNISFSEFLQPQVSNNQVSGCWLFPPSFTEPPQACWMTALWIWFGHLEVM